jgi:hypothetical protein
MKRPLRPLLSFFKNAGNSAFQTIPDLLRFADESQPWLTLVASQSLQQIIPSATQTPA